MPRKTRFAIEDITQAALQVVRRDGMEKLTARTVAAELNASTMPIYSCGKTMAEIEEAVVEKAWEVLERFQDTPRSGDLYLDMGLGYVLFAKEERHLYKCIHSDKYPGINTAMAEDNLKRSMKRVVDYPLLEGLPDEIKETVLIQGWIYSHGFADLMLNPLTQNMRELETEAQIVDSFIKANAMYWEGLKGVVEKHRSL
ncbi:TetR/AcrR family transcriptional regulator [Desulfoluna spongiiphila]|uniref:Transcriptional regulator, TetR family n=1 Tax=Desulfoluna spongiiphila TaxID=419481 RepID=A0A1G5F8S2_9BACT|nr:TetR/AcrR family transcriptional regulator [Desulfoluna spongiiphila]SCY35048.1 transcriptional regulator, TetR family [Desulfoluna spongiiphila]